MKVMHHCIIITMTCHRLHGQQKWPYLPKISSGSCEILKITSNTLYIQKKNMQTVMAAAIYKKNSYNLFVHNSVPTFS